MDGAIFAQSDCSRIGVVIRDANLVFIVAKVMTFPCQYGVVEVEAIATREGTASALEHGCLTEELESDSITIVKLCLGSNQLCALVGLLIDDVRTLIFSFEEF